MSPLGRALLLLALFSARGFASSSLMPCNLFGLDKRVPLTTRLYPMSAIGIVKQFDEKNEVVETCTGALVGRRLVLTARHCVGMKGNKLSTRIRTVFLAGVIGGQLPHGEAPIAAIEGRGGEWRTAADSRKGDWAILVLEKSPLPETVTDDAFLTVAPEVPTEGSHLISIGYSADYENGNTPTADFDCRVRAVLSDGVFHHDCGTYAGASGGPLLAAFPTPTGRVLKIVGVHNAHKSGGTRGLRLDSYRAGFANLGTGTANFIHILRSIADNSLLSQR